jgi:error-prone DNA polymerase
VIARQRPGTAKGVIFATLEDETGVANIVIWSKIYERYRRIVLTSRLLMVRGRVQREGLVIHLVADHLEDKSHLLEALGERDFEPALAHADEIKYPTRSARSRARATRANRPRCCSPRAIFIEDWVRQQSGSVRSLRTGRLPQMRNRTAPTP